MATLTARRDPTAPATAMATRTRPRSATALAVLAIVEGLSAIAGGTAFLIDTTGGIYTDDPAFLDVLEGTPIETFLLPGLFLVSVIGLVPVASGWAILRPYHLPGLGWVERLTGSHWSWAVTGMVGVALLAWMAVEVAVMEEIAALHVVYGVWGALLVAGSLLPSVRRWLAR